MSDKKGKLETVIRATLAEAKKSHEARESKAKERAEEKAEKKMKMEEIEQDEEEFLKDEEEEAVEEETAAAASLHPAAKAIADPQALSASKVGMMSGVMSVMAGMDKDSQLNFFNSVMAQYGPGKTFGVGDNSEHNKSTLDMKPSNAPGGSWDVKMPMPQINAKEDVEAMFSSEELSEEFKEKASVLFEAAVNAKVIAEMAKLEEQYEQSITEELKVFTEEVVDKLDAYLDYVVENWMADNEVAIESTLRNESMDEFISGLKNLFSEHYIEVPETKVDVIEALAQKVETLETELDRTISENNEMKTVIYDSAKKEIMEELSEGLTLMQKEKFKTLSEGIEFEGDVDSYEKKLRIIKETYFKNNKPISSNINEETFEGSLTEEKNLDPIISQYVNALTRTAKK